MALTQAAPFWILKRIHPTASRGSLDRTFAQFSPGGIMSTKKSILRKILIVLGLICAAIIAPYVLIGVGMSLEKAAKENERRHYVPTDLVDAVKFQYATP